MVNRGTRFTCLKFFLMSSNAFVLVVGIFLIPFGLSYPEEGFPGGYSGKEAARIAGVFIFFALIGYCGAHHQKIYLLILYAAIIFLFIIRTICVWIVLLVEGPESEETETIVIPKPTRHPTTTVDPLLQAFGLKPKTAGSGEAAKLFVYSVCGFFLVLMAIGIFLSWQIRRTSQTSTNGDSKVDSPDQCMTSPINTAAHPKINV